MGIHDQRLQAHFPFFAEYASECLLSAKRAIFAHKALSHETSRKGFDVWPSGLTWDVTRSSLTQNVEKTPMRCSQTLLKHIRHSSEITRAPLSLEQVQSTPVSGKGTSSSTRFEETRHIHVEPTVISKDSGGTQIATHPMAGSVQWNETRAKFLINLEKFQTSVRRIVHTMP